MVDVHPALLRSIRLNRKHLQLGRVIAIDPSSGSHASKPAYAIFEAGKLTQADSIKLPANLLDSVNYTPHRLRYIAEILRELGEFDLLVIECFHWRPNARTNLKSIQQLNQSVGCIWSAIQWKYVLQVMGFEWRRHSPSNYQKSDIDDAVQIGSWVIQLSREEL